jgi:2-polyprenyl-3-methyl-5-hydroxy-6-metoxy-1,4-benzoquinol methylase
MSIEEQRLSTIASNSRYAEGLNAASVGYSVRIFARHWRPGSCLELGPAEGLATALLVKHFTDLTCVDGAPTFCRVLAERHHGVRVECSLIEEYAPDRTFDNIVLGHVLEHVEDPVAVLKHVAIWLSAGGRIFASVPNARSLHRQLGVVMGLLPTEHSLNPLDLHHGHRRVYDPDSFRGDFRAAGLDIVVSGGYWIKPAANAHLEANWSPDMIEAAMVVGERYPDIAAEIYIVAGR